MLVRAFAVSDSYAEISVSEQRNAETNMDEKRPVGKNCPFVARPMPGCRVHEITGQTIPNILECCGDRFAECPLFKNKQADGESAKCRTKS